MLPFPAGCGQKGNEKRGKSQNMLPFPAGCGQKGNEKRETKRNPLPLEPARSKKGNNPKIKRSCALRMQQLLFNRFDASK